MKSGACQAELVSDSTEISGIGRVNSALDFTLGSDISLTTGAIPTASAVSPGFGLDIESPLSRCTNVANGSEVVFVAQTGGAKLEHVGGHFGQRIPSGPGAANFGVPMP